ncbi:leucine-rich repeat extensin-like protein 2 [Penaeus monodon]|uniref:leucine-rich repeat extensin-like protein 2 n=1 Tax=Penaeus monodon TaxID=6687 RepID=UPI0018A6E9A8|nr:leucine-rich repeat extensin-like protein 2 [Penaeus monodon]
MKADQLPALRAARAQGKIAYFVNTKLVIKEKTNHQRPGSENAAQPNHPSTTEKQRQPSQHPRLAETDRRITRQTPEGFTPGAPPGQKAPPLDPVEISTPSRRQTPPGPPVEIFRLARRLAPGPPCGNFLRLAKGYPPCENISLARRVSPPFGSPPGPPLGNISPTQKARPLDPVAILAYQNPTPPGPPGQKANTPGPPVVIYTPSQKATPPGPPVVTFTPSQRATPPGPLCTGNKTFFTDVSRRNGMAGLSSNLPVANAQAHKDIA